MFDIDIEYIKCTLFCSNLRMQSKKALKEWALNNFRSKETDELLKFLLDKNVTTGISSARLSKHLAKELDPHINMTLLDVCKYIIDNPANDDTLWVVQSYVEKVRLAFESRPTFNNEMAFIHDVFTKQLRLGVDAKTVNSVYRCKLIPVFDVQLAKSIDNVKIPHGEWFSVSQKINGNRCTCYRGKMYSRQGKLWTGLDHIMSDLKKLEVELPVWCLDGELVYKNSEGLSDNDAFTKGTGILNSPDSDKSCIKYVIFDWISNRDFDNGISQDSYKARKDLLIELSYDIHRLGIENVEVVRFFYEGTDETKIDYWIDRATKAGMEGVMVNYDVPYQCKRNSGILKAKRFYTMDLPILGFDVGNGRLSNTLGKVYVEYKENVVGVGSGFSDELRSEIWNNKRKYLGSIIEVKYKNISKDKDTGMLSLQFPVFVRFRDDKNEPSYD